jgi:hypothetical protein
MICSRKRWRTTRPARAAAIQRLARRNFERLKVNPHHPSLHFKKVGRHWSVRVGSNYRAVGKPVDDGMLWIWIGTHADYDTILRS